MRAGTGRPSRGCCPACITCQAAARWCRCWCSPRMAEGDAGVRSAPGKRQGKRGGQGTVQHPLCGQLSAKIQGWIPASGQGLRGASCSARGSVCVCGGGHTGHQVWSTTYEYYQPGFAANPTSWAAHICMFRSARHNFTQRSANAASSAMPSQCPLRNHQPPTVGSTTHMPARAAVASAGSRDEARQARPGTGSQQGTYMHATASLHACILDITAVSHYHT